MIDPDPPKPSALETALVLLKTAALAAVTGGDISSFADALIHFMQLPISRRHDEWLRQMAEAVLELERKVAGFSIESLQNDDHFISTVLNASAIAIRTHRKQKLNALRNAVVHSVTQKDIDEDEKALFLHHIDFFTVSHLNVLFFLADAEGYCKRQGRNLKFFIQRDGNPTKWGMHRNCYSMFKDVFPELVGNIQLGDTLLFDLGSRTLIPVRNMSERLPDFGPALTHTGERFIRYIGVLGTEE